jgi:signal transduction histidine kinase
MTMVGLARKRVERAGNRGRLSSRLTMLLMVLLSISLVACLTWSFFLQQRIANRKALAEAQVLSREMSAIWDYVNDIQNRINFDLDGSYNFKGVYCTIAAKNIAQRFMRETDYTIRYVRDSPRSSTGQPDDFETLALTEFAQTGESQYYDYVDYGGAPALRYVEALYAKGNCLECHGDPAGERDAVGYIKEGMRYGDIAGAVSLVIPLETSGGEGATDIVGSILFFSTGILGVILVMRLAMRRWVFDPLRGLEGAAADLGGGKLEIDPGLLDSPGEIGNLAREFSSMAARLKGVLDTLEQQVDERTAQLASANQVLVEQREQIARANATLQDVNARLVEESASKSNFLAIMNHELKTPLAAILSVTEIWEKTTPVRPAEAMRLIREIQVNCRVLLGAIENTIDTARLEAGRFELTEDETDLVDVVGEILALVQPLAEKRQITLTSSIDERVPVLYSSWDALHKILMNLVSNAVKFTGQGGEVSVLVGFDEAAGEVVLRVVDNGIGISPEDLARIFERFTQSDSSGSRRYGGSGLGLSLVKELAELLGGRVEVRSGVDEGSEFSVMLPIEPQAHKEAL